jgi:hypothetical protein
MVLIPMLAYSMTREANSRGDKRGRSCFHPIPAARHGVMQHARHREHEASTLPSLASPLCHDKTALLRRVPLGDVGTGGGGRGAGGGLRAGLGGLDGRPRR